MLPYNLKRLLYLSPLSNNWLVHYIRYLNRKGVIKQRIKKFGREADTLPLLPKMRRAYVKFHWNADEFFLFKYEALDDEQRKAFCPEYDHNIFCLRVNDFSVARIFRNKWATYQKFKPFFKRECIFVETKEDLQRSDLQTFLEQNDVFLAKPIAACCGRGILKLTPDLVLQGALSHIEKGKGVLLEPYIKQSKEIGLLHPESVNTVRIPTVNYGDRIELFHPFLRIGRGTSFVDNAGAGGIGCNVDVTTGTVICAGDELGNDFTVHPESKKNLVGYRIPKWNDAVAMVKQLASLVPDVHYVGWDLALTDNGWVLIEANEDGQFLFQYFSHAGCAQEVQRVYKDLKDNHRLK